MTSCEAGGSSLGTTAPEAAFDSLGAGSVVSVGTGSAVDTEVDSAADVDAGTDSVELDSDGDGACEVVAGSEVGGAGSRHPLARISAPVDPAKSVPRFLPGYCAAV